MVRILVLLFALATPWDCVPNHCVWDIVPVQVHEVKVTVEVKSQEVKLVDGFYWWFDADGTRWWWEPRGKLWHCWETGKTKPQEGDKPQTKELCPTGTCPTPIRGR